MIPMDWIRKNSWMKLGWAWFSFTDLAIENEIETTTNEHFGCLNCERWEKQRTMKAMKWLKRVREWLVQVIMVVRSSMGPWEVSNSMEPIEIPWKFIIVDTTNVWHLGLHPMISIPNKKTSIWKGIWVQGLIQKCPQTFGSQNTNECSIQLHVHPQAPPLQLVERRNLEHLVTLAVTKMKCLLHLQNTNFKSKANYMHRSHHVERNVVRVLHLGNILCFSKILVVLILFF